MTHIIYMYCLQWIGWWPTGRAVMKTVISKAFSNFLPNVRPESVLRRGIVRSGRRLSQLLSDVQYLTLDLICGSGFSLQLELPSGIQICDINIPYLPIFPDSSVISCAKLSGKLLRKWSKLIWELGSSSFAMLLFCETGHLALMP